MHPCQLISQALQKKGKTLPELPCEPVMAMCAVTGETCLCLPRKYVLGKAFTNGDLLASPDSQFVSVDVFYTWNYGYFTAPKPLDEKLEQKLLSQGIRSIILDLWKAVEAQKHQTEESFLEALGGKTEEVEMILAATRKKITKRPERMSSWFCDGETFTELNRIGVRHKVFQKETSKIWSAYATISYKKHGSLLATVNTGSQRFWLFEERIVNCSDMKQVNVWWEKLNTALYAGIGRMVLESLECPPYLMQKVGLLNWIDFEQWARPKYLSNLYAFLCYLLPSQEEMKNGNL